MRTQMLACRTFGHAWEPTDVPEGYRGKGTYGFALALLCTRCETLRLESWDRYGRTSFRRYLYPDEYKEACMSLREGRNDGQTVREEARRRYLAIRRKR